MEIVVRGRHMEISDRFREHVSQKLAKIERYDGKCHRVDVEVSQESNPRLADQAVRVEITCHGKGPVVRAEAAADEKSERSGAGRKVRDFHEMVNDSRYSNSASAVRRPISSNLSG